MSVQMKITEVENKGLNRAYDVVIGARVVEQNIEKELARIGKTVKMPGFRPGKVPPRVLKQKYGQSVMGDALQRLVNEASDNVIRKNNLRPALTPKVTVTSFEEGSDLALSIVVELMPEVPEIDFAKVSVERPVVKVLQDDIDRAIDVLRQRYRDVVAKKSGAKAESGDVVVIDFKGFIGKDAFEGGEAKGYSLELGSGQFIPGFEEQLIGAKAGDDVEVNVPFPKEYHKQELAGKKARFEVKINEVKSVELPQADEEFAKKLGQESIKQLREILEKQLEAEYSGLVRSTLKKSLFDALEKHCKFNAPEGMLKLEFDSIWQQHEQAKSRGQVDANKPEKEFKDEYAEIAERRVKLGILLSDVARKQNIQVTPQELGRAVQEQARMYPGQEQQVLEFFKKNQQAVQELRGPILEEKSVDYILSQVKTKDKPVTIKELMESEEEEFGGGHVHGPDCDHGDEHVHDENCGHDHAKKKPAKKAAAEEKSSAKPAAKKATASKKKSDK